MTQQTKDKLFDWVKILMPMAFALGGALIHQHGQFAAVRVELRHVTDGVQAGREERKQLEIRLREIERGVDRLETRMNSTSTTKTKPLPKPPA